jgi:flavin reductase (DIM6/NTAB) family NADH-FMN oxidoreductase RutF
VESSFAAFAAGLDYAMFIVTGRDSDGKGGCLVGFAMQCSITPPRFAVGISKKNHTFGIVQRSDFVAVHLVPEDAMDLAELFGGQTGDRVDKFSLCQWREGPVGLPILSRCQNWFAGRIVDRVDAGDHIVIVLDPFEVESGRGVTPLRFAEAKAIAPGHEP